MVTTATATATAAKPPSALRWHDAALSALTKWRRCREHRARRAITVCTCARAGRQCHARSRRGAQCRSNRLLDGPAVGEDPCHYAELVVLSGSCGNSWISCEVVRSLLLSHSGQSRSEKSSSSETGRSRDSIPYPPRQRRDHEIYLFSCQNIISTVSSSDKTNAAFGLYFC